MAATIRGRTTNEAVRNRDRRDATATTTANPVTNYAADGERGGAEVLLTVWLADGTSTVWTELAERSLADVLSRHLEEADAARRELVKEAGGKVTESQVEACLLLIAHGCKEGRAQPAELSWGALCALADSESARYHSSMGNNSGSGDGGMVLGYDSLPPRRKPGNVLLWASRPWSLHATLDLGLKSILRSITASSPSTVARGNGSIDGDHGEDDKRELVAMASPQAAAYRGSSTRGDVHATVLSQIDLTAYDITCTGSVFSTLLTLIATRARQKDIADSAISKYIDAKLAARGCEALVMLADTTHPATVGAAPTAITTTTTSPILACISLCNNNNHTNSTQSAPSSGGAAAAAVSSSTGVRTYETKRAEWASGFGALAQCKSEQYSNRLEQLAVTSLLTSASSSREKGRSLRVRIESAVRVACRTSYGDVVETVLPESFDVSALIAQLTAQKHLLQPAPGRVWALYEGKSTRPLLPFEPVGRLAGEVLRISDDPAAHVDFHFVKTPSPIPGVSRSGGRGGGAVALLGASAPYQQQQQVQTLGTAALGVASAAYTPVQMERWAKRMARIQGLATSADHRSRVQVRKQVMDAGNTNNRQIGLLGASSSSSFMSFPRHVWTVNLGSEQSQQQHSSLVPFGGGGGGVGGGNKERRKLLGAKRPSHTRPSLVAAQQRQQQHHHQMASARGGGRNNGGDGRFIPVTAVYRPGGCSSCSVARVKIKTARRTKEKQKSNDAGRRRHMNCSNDCCSDDEDCCESSCSSSSSSDSDSDCESECECECHCEVTIDECGPGRLRAPWECAAQSALIDSQFSCGSTDCVTLPIVVRFGRVWRPIVICRQFGRPLYGKRIIQEAIYAFQLDDRFYEYALFFYTRDGNGAYEGDGLARGKGKPNTASGAYSSGVPGGLGRQPGVRKSGEIGPNEIVVDTTVPEGYVVRFELRRIRRCGPIWQPFLLASFLALLLFIIVAWFIFFSPGLDLLNAMLVEVPSVSWAFIQSSAIVPGLAPPVPALFAPTPTIATADGGIYYVSETTNTLTLSSALQVYDPSLPEFATLNTLPLQISPITGNFELDCSSACYCEPCMLAPQQPSLSELLGPRVVPGWP